MCLILFYILQVRMYYDEANAIQPKEIVEPKDIWLPLGYNAPEEARLNRFGLYALQGAIDWQLLNDWWLVHKQGASTPNWEDFQLSYEKQTALKSSGTKYFARRRNGTRIAISGN